MHFPPFLLIPLASALLYVVSMLAMKRAADFGVGVWRTAFLANWTTALLFVPLWLWRGWADVPVADYLQPALVAVVYLLAQVCMLLAITRGEVSVAGPVMGLKVILVAFFSSVLHVGVVPVTWWVGAGLSTLAVALLNLGGGRVGRPVGSTVLMAATSAVFFSLSDVLIQKLAPAWGPGNFFPPMFLMVGLYSFALLLFARGRLADIGTGAWRWVGLGSVCNSCAHAGIALTLGIWGHATAVNIIYSTRGLFSVVLVWWVGHWFSNTESQAGRGVLLARLAGTVAMLGAIGLVMV